MRRGRRQYDADDYFNFLYDLAFFNDNNIELAKMLHDIPYVCNYDDRSSDGFEIRKYYLSDSNGYLPDDIDEYDEYIFPDRISVLEMLVGFSNRINRDLTNKKAVDEIFEMFMKNWGIWGSSYDDERYVKNVVKRWEMGDERYSLFKLGEKGDLWSQANKWADTIDPI